MPHPAPAAQAQLQQLYTEHHSWLKTWLRQRLGCHQQAADLAQDTFLRLLCGAEPVAARQPRPLLVTVARRVMSNHFRRQRIEQAYLEVLASQPALEAPSLEAQAIVVETLEALDRLLDGLGTPVRQAFLWSQLDGLGHGEIATRLGVSVTSVKRYITKAGLQCFFAAQA
ncbi:sigma-70 family RNA polymerase sigma factor [Pseudomonas sp. NPDC007930]|uniref:sigma-70 family RNA polymerase sigma factor n=1 Tax=Pseudomonas sp. NPDC007930 TaxID=3364417 RepID=UPI0036DFD610